MKIKKLLSLTVVIALLSLLTLPAFAVESRASSQIAAYDIRVTTVPNFIATYVTVTGVGVVDKLGCESIYVYKMVEGSWVLDQTKLEDDTNMSSTNTYAHKDTIYCNGTYGEYYKVVVTIFAENSKGRTSRTETFFVTGKPNSPS